MAKGKSPKPPLFQYQHSIFWKTYFKYQASEGEGTKKRQMQWNGNDIAAPPQEMHFIRMKGNSGDELQQN